MLSGVYIIYCLASKKFYLGSAKDCEDRFLVHKIALYKGQHTNKHLQNAWNKYGDSQFIFDILEECPKTEVKLLEQVYLTSIKGSNDVYNTGFLATGWGGNHTLETKEKISQTLSSHLADPEVRNQRSQASKEVWSRPEYREKMCLLRTGKPKSATHKVALSMSERGKIVSQETCQRISDSKRNRPWSLARRGAHLSANGEVY